jgi:hypothetical protein
MLREAPLVSSASQFRQFSLELQEVVSALLSKEGETQKEDS